MTLLFVGTETTRLGRQDRVVQVAWLLADQDGVVRHVESRIIRPDGFSIPRQAAEIHRITTERAHREGGALARGTGQH